MRCASNTFVYLTARPDWISFTRFVMAVFLSRMTNAGVIFLIAMEEDVTDAFLNAATEAIDGVCIRVDDEEA